MKGTTEIDNLTVQMALYISFISDDPNYKKGIFFVLEPFSGEDFFYTRSKNGRFEIEGELYLVTDPADLKSHIDEAIERGNNFYYKPFPE